MMYQNLPKTTSDKIFTLTAANSVHLCELATVRGAGLTYRSIATIGSLLPFRSTTRADTKSSLTPNVWIVPMCEDAPFALCFRITHKNNKLFRRVIKREQHGASCLVWTQHKMWSCFHFFVEGDSVFMRHALYNMANFLVRGPAVTSDPSVDKHTASSRWWTPAPSHNALGCTHDSDLLLCCVDIPDSQ